MTAKSEPPPQTDTQRLLCELARAKVAFQQRAVLAHIGAKEAT